MKKYKLKSKSSATKRFSVTASGKIKRKKAYLRHMLRKRTTGCKRKLRATGYIAKADIAGVKRMLPYN